MCRRVDQKWSNVLFRLFRHYKRNVTFNVKGPEVFKPADFSGWLLKIGNSPRINISGTERIFTYSLLSTLTWNTGLCEVLRCRPQYILHCLWIINQVATELTAPALAHARRWHDILCHVCTALTTGGTLVYIRTVLRWMWFPYWRFGTLSYF